MHRSKSFTQSLSADEARILSQLSSMFEESAWNLSPKTEIEFSEKREEFLLGGVERTAKTSALREDPIIFNLGLIQSPSTNINALDVSQILVHEMLHKLGPSAEAIGERLAAKVREGLLPYYQKFELHSQVNVHSLILPQARKSLVFEIGQAEALILFEYRGRYIPAQLVLQYVGKSLNSRFFVDHQSIGSRNLPSGNFQKHFLFKMTGLNVSLNPDGEIDLEIPLEATESLVFMDPRARGWEAVEGSQLMRPVQNFIDLAPPARNLVKIHRHTSLQWLKNWGRDSNMMTLNSPLSDPPEEFLADVTGIEVQLERLSANGEVRGVLQSSEEISRVQAVSGNYIWPVQVRSLGGGRYSLAGKIKPPHASSSKLEISQLIVNGSSLVSLPRPIVVESKVTNVSREKIEKVQAFVDGHWIEISELKGRELTQLKVRVAVSENYGSPYQVHAYWTAPTHVVWDGLKVAEIHDELHEVLQAQSLKRTRDNGQTWIEFETKDIFSAVAKIPAQQKIRYSDSWERVLSEIRVIDGAGNSARHLSRSETFRDRPFFNVKTCETSLVR